MSDVSTPTERIAELEHKRELTRAIMGGTFAMRAAGKKFLPQHPAEGDNVYGTRLKKTFLDNFVSLQIDKSVGKIFAKPVRLDNVPAEVETLLDNVDRQGRNIHSYMMDVCKQAFIDGISYVLADMPPVEGVQTREQEKSLGVRPYALHIKAQDIIELRSEMVSGVETLTRLRLRECVSVPVDEWTTEIISQIRVLTLDGGRVNWQLYRQNEKQKWILYDEGLTSFKRIYLVPFYANRTGYLEGSPSFQKTAEANLEHWQTKSEYAHALSMQCFGMLTATGVNADDNIVSGPCKVLRTSSPDAKFSYTEPSGVGITLAATALQAIESRIESAGVNLRVENAGKVTATAAALDSEDTTAGLKAVAHGFGDSLELLLSFFAEIMGIADTSEAEFNTDFGQCHGSDAGLQSLDKARALGDISRTAYIEALKWRGELAEDFDIDANAEELASESPALSAMPTM